MCLLNRRHMTKKVTVLDIDNVIEQGVKRPDVGFRQTDTGLWCIGFLMGN